MQSQSSLFRLGDDVLKVILSHVSSKDSTWLNVLLSCKRLNRLALPIFSQRDKYRRRIVLLGGRVCKDDTEETFSSSCLMYMYSGLDHRWHKIRYPPSIVYNSACVTIDNHIHAVGGTGTYKQPGSSLSRYNMVAREWESMAPMNEAKFNVEVVLIRKRFLYAFSRGNLGCSKFAEVYDTTENTWMPSSLQPIYGPVVNLNDNIALVGATQRHNENLPSSEVKLYIIDRYSWRKLPSMPTPRRLHAAVSYGNSIYALGGKSAALHLNSVEHYDDRSKKWTTMPPMPTPRSELRAVMAGDSHIYAIGGRMAGCDCWDVVERYDRRANVWETLEPLPEETTKWFGLVTVVEC